MFLPILGDLPFPRGKTASQGLLTPTGTYLGNLEGKAFFSEDTEHGTGTPIVVLCVRNTTGGDITVARTFAELDNTTVLSVSGAVDVHPNVTAGAVCLPLDDAYIVGATIADDDLFYVGLYGYFSVLTGASVTNLAAGISISSDNAGKIANVSGGSAAGEFVVGRLPYQATYVATTATAIFVCPGSLAMPPAAG